MSKKTEDLFDEEFFDAGIEDPGFYTHYSFENHYPAYLLLATQIKNQFNPTRVLDIGCAKGFLVKAQRDIGIDAWGVDISEYAISSALNDLQPYLYKVDLDKEILPFKDNHFDFITILGVIEYLNNHKHIINEVKRVLRVGGVLYLTTMYKREPEDKIRMNIHDKAYWIKEFESNGFKFIPNCPNYNSIVSTVSFKKFIAQNLQQRRTMKYKFARFLYEEFGTFGRQLCFYLYSWHHKYCNRIFRNLGTLCFRKVGDK